MNAESDFDIAKSIEDLLKGKERDRQQRILRWVGEILNLEIGQVAADPMKAKAFAEKIADEAQRRKGWTDIKTFVDSKDPKSDVQFATVVAYYYRFEAPPESRKAEVSAENIREAARLARRRQPQSALKALNNAKGQGYLDSAGERGQFKINSVGENLVAMTLPGNLPNRAKRAAQKAKKRKQKAKARKRRQG